MKALDFVKDVSNFLIAQGKLGPYEHEKNCDEVIKYLFNALVEDLGKILKSRTKARYNDIVYTFFDEYSVDSKSYELHLGSILKEINLKAEKINKLGKYGFSENWFQLMFIEHVKNYIKGNPKSSWRFYFDCPEMEGVSYPAFNFVKDFLNP